MNQLWLTFYGDDFTGSTDALEQLTLAGIRTALFIEPPTAAQLRRFPQLQAVGVAGLTRSMIPGAMKKVLRPAFKKLKALGARHVHYKVCSTFDSSPQIGNLGCVLDVAENIFRAPFVPLLVAAPALGRYTIFGHHFARYGIGSEGEIYRLDQHPAVSRHPITPMQEADLRRHLARQTRKKIALFDILKVALPEKEARLALKRTLVEKPDVILFDAVENGQMAKIGGLIDGYARLKQPLFSVGSSGVELALGAWWKLNEKKREGRIDRLKIMELGNAFFQKKAVKPFLIGSGSCSPVTSGQIDWALKNGFAEVPLKAAAFVAGKKSDREIQRTTRMAVNFLQAGRDVIVHTTRTGSDQRLAAKLKAGTAPVLGTALGKVLRGALEQAKVGRLCLAGGDTSSYAARALGIEAVEMIRPLTPGAPLCRACSKIPALDGLEVVFKGGQVGAENYFEVVRQASGDWKVP